MITTKLKIVSIETNLYSIEIVCISSRITTKLKIVSIETYKIKNYFKKFIYYDKAQNREHRNLVFHLIINTNIKWLRQSSKSWASKHRLNQNCRGSLLSLRQSSKSWASKLFIHFFSVPFSSSNYDKAQNREHRNFCFI